MPPVKPSPIKKTPRPSHLFQAGLSLLSIMLLAPAALAQNDILRVETDAWQATFRHGALVGLVDAQDRDLVTVGDTGRSFELHVNGKTYLPRKTFIDEASAEGIAKIEFSQFPKLTDAEGALQISVTEKGDLYVLPTAQTETGLESASWTIAYIPLEYNIISTRGGGEKLTRNSPYKVRNYDYPLGWDAQLLIVEGKDHGFYLFGDDTHGSPKNVRVERSDKGWKIVCTSINDAPFDDKTTLQPRRWYINTYEGDWRVPAQRYRAWAAAAFGAKPLADHNPAWVADIYAFTTIEFVNDELLQELARQFDPKQTLLYMHHWRNQHFDRDAPNYHEPAENYLAFIKKAQALGFKVMVHVNFWGVSPDHPIYAEMAPYHLLKQDGSRGRYANYNQNPPVIMNYISPASKKWREFFIGELKRTLEATGADAIHLDQNFHAHNDFNGIIDGLTFNEGILQYHKEVREALPGIALGGEGLNELTFAYMDFAQRHVWSAMGGTVDRAALSIAHPIDSYLFQPYTRHYGWLGFPHPMEKPQPYNAWMENYMVWGIYPYLRYFREDSPLKLAQPVGFHQQLVEQLKTFQRLRLEPDLDGAWPDDVLFPFIGEDGTPVRWMSNRSFVVDGEEKFRTLIDVSEVELPGKVDGWLFYNDTKIYGLEPERFYAYFNEPRDLHAPHVDSIPDGLRPDGARLSPDFLLFQLRRNEAPLLSLVEALPEAQCGLLLDSGETYTETGGVSGRYGSNLSGAAGTLAITPPSKARLATDLESTVGNQAKAVGEIYASYQVYVPEDGHAAFISEVGLDGRAVRTRQCDGMDFTVRATAGDESREAGVFAPDDAKLPLNLDLAPFAGKTITLQLIAGAGPREDATEDRGIWYQPRVVQFASDDSGDTTLAGLPKDWSHAFNVNESLEVKADGDSKQIAAKAGLTVAGNRAPLAVEPGQALADLPYTLTQLDVWGWPLPEGEPAPTLTPQGENFEVHLPLRTQLIVDWLLQLPDTPAIFQTQVSNRSGPGGTGSLYAVLSVNDQELNRIKLPGGKESVPLSFDLAAYAGQNVVLSLTLVGKDIRGDFTVRVVEPSILEKPERKNRGDGTPQTVIDEEFAYADGPLGDPWTITYDGLGKKGTASEIVTASTPLDGFTPAGKQLTISRPDTKEAGAPAMKLVTTANSPAVQPWEPYSDDQLQLSFDLSLTDIQSGASCIVQLMGGPTANSPFFGLRLVGTSNSNGKFQVQTTGSFNSFRDLILNGRRVGADANAWYRVTYTGTLGATYAGGAAGRQYYDLKIERLGNQPEVIFSERGLSLEPSSAIMGTIGLKVATTGALTYNLADVQLQASIKP